jgi:hypothetical protein
LHIFSHTHESGRNLYIATFLPLQKEINHMYGGEVAINMPKSDANAARKHTTRGNKIEPV